MRTYLHQAEADTLTPPGVEDKKAEGNDRFREGDYEAAVICYGEALAALESGHNPTLRAALLSNQSAPCSKEPTRGRHRRTHNDVQHGSSRNKHFQSL
jgi:hypothetical protein